MLTLFFLIATAIFFMLIFAAISFTIFGKRISFEKKVEDYFQLTSSMRETEKNKMANLNKRHSSWVKDLWKQGIEQMEKKTPAIERKNLTRLIRDAGLSSKVTAVEFRLIQILISLGGGFLVLVLFTPLADKKPMIFILAFAIGFLGLRYPLFFLAKKKTMRIKEINKDMPDFFDTVNLLIEAGVGLDSALATVCRKKRGPLSEEFLVALDDMKRGKTRREAFYELKMRVASEALQSVLTSLIQADQLGVGMAKVLKSLTTRIREQRREAAREQAMKAPVKMLFPMILFIFPSLFIVVLGPLIVKLAMGGLGG
ncbi:type II secretion system F family protein [Litchfieldia salsa]|uniref:Tight adherence protein C n=1 Tax=Litchfieldia salsa TaxID=930152 RepID=A0A1H0UC12_9BACI|nr:type II secretion system F family protein [Litchfieldia salsa]SDP63671.1 tight adherence protein C [Litchfieldia salsa]